IVFTIVQIGRPQELVSALAPLRLGLLSAGFTVAAAWAEGRLTNLRVIFRNTETRCVLALVLLGAISAPLGVWPTGSFTFVTDDYLKVVFFFFLLQVIVRTLADLRRLVWAIVLSSFILAVTAYLYSTGMIQLSELQGQIGFESGLERVTVSDTYSANE